MTTYALKFDTGALDALKVKLEGLTGDELGKAVTTSLNDVVGKAYDLSRKRMITGINLTDAYLRRKMVLTQATSAKPVASILAEGSRKGFSQTNLSHFRSVQKERDVTWSNAKIQSMGKKFGKWPGWTERTGNRAIGIAPNRKANGMSATVKSTRLGFQHAFAIVKNGNAIRDGDGVPIMFTRAKGATREVTRSLLGPAVYQLFKYQFKGTLLAETEEMLAEALTTQVQAAVEKALNT